MKTYVLDASALMAFFEDRPGAEKVEDLLAKAAEGKRPLLMSVINWGEVYYSIWRARGEAAANEKLQQIAQLPIQILDADATLTQAAASLKAQHNLPYADCFAASLAQTRNLAIVTTDRDLRRTGNVVETVWL